MECFLTHIQEINFIYHQAKSLFDLLSLADREPEKDAWLGGQLLRLPLPQVKRALVGGPLHSLALCSRGVMLRREPCMHLNG